MARQRAVLPAGGGDTGPSSSTTDNADVTEAHVAFVTGMKPHHAQAVEMSDLVLDSDPSPDFHSGYAGSIPSPALSELAAQK